MTFKISTRNLAIANSQLHRSPKWPSNFKGHSRLSD